MAKVINFQESEKVLNALKSSGKKVVITGGCFDIIHIGHAKFLQEAGRMGDLLVVLLENDKKVSNLKGQNRPVFKQKERAQMLAALSCVDYVILLPFMKSDADYEKLIYKLKPDIIAVTANDPNTDKKKKQAKRIDAVIKKVPHIKTYSTSSLAKIIGID